MTESEFFKQSGIEGKHSIDNWGIIRESTFDRLPSFKESIQNNDLDIINETLEESI